ncbi:hypothetical protein C8R44DRAFT_890426 [Mycena epipterygia]|nr:hypothetical protein C8R44DRAFT_890426 [Mycena epipterygia]
MRSTFATLLVLASFLGGAVAQNLVINTPTPAPVSCEPTLLTWGGGSPPYIIMLFILSNPVSKYPYSVVDSDDPTQTLVNFGSLSNTSLTWTVTEPVGQHCLLTIKDNTGFGETSAPFTILGGGPTNCLGVSSSSSVSGSSTTPSKSSSNSASSTVPVSTSTTTSVSVVASTTPTSTKPLSTAPSVTPSSTKPASTSSGSGSPTISTSPSPTSNAARSTGVAGAAAAAAIGAVFAALL